MGQFAGACAPWTCLAAQTSPRAKSNADSEIIKWMRTGDEAVVRRSVEGNEHIFIVDRIKELIKVKVFGLQDGTVGNIG